MSAPRHRTSRRPRGVRLAAICAAVATVATLGVVAVGSAVPHVESDGPATPFAAAADHRVEPIVSRARPGAGEASAQVADALVPPRESRYEAPVIVRATRTFQKREPVAKTGPSGGPFSFTLASFNVLGSQHTGPGGSRNYPSASWRSPQAVALIRKHGADIVGMQELQDDQLRTIAGQTGMAAWPGFSWGVKETDNSILYDASRFEFVSGSQFTITFMSRARPQPILRLRDRASGSEFYVVNTHPSAGGGKYAAERRRAQSVTVGIVSQLKASGLPVFLTGDMNDRAAFFCNVVAPAGMVAANGGSTAGGCRPPPEPMPVDWVTAAGATFSNYWRDTSPVDRKVSDHFFISARVSVG